MDAHLEYIRYFGVAYSEFRWVGAKGFLTTKFVMLMEKNVINFLME